MNTKGAKIKTKTNKQDYTVGTVAKFIRKIEEAGNRKHSISGLSTCILILRRQGYTSIFARSLPIFAME